MSNANHLRADTKIVGIDVDDKSEFNMFIFLKFIMISKIVEVFFSNSLNMIQKLDYTLERMVKK